ncbi:hypothetical protein NDU88_004643 [Pleurodeles waltl]|uniref:Uncharacterized protein n=1 Tax=Pleurodeles waltl TaxID=8319 RepID=A0AAV7T8Q4_PLEWA|nr:hypothetical protein NDU88_004643 [Pleurodeles waltl]
MEPGYVEQALLLLRRAGRIVLVNQEALRALRPARRAAKGVAAAVLACSPPSSPARGAQVRIPGRVTGWGRGWEKVSGAGRTAIKGAGLRRRVGGFQHAHKGGAGALKARSLKGKEKLRHITVGREANRSVGNRSGGKGNAEASSEEGSWGGGSPQGTEERGQLSCS